MQDVPCDTFSSGCHNQGSCLSWAVLHAPEMLAGEEAVLHHICHGIQIQNSSCHHRIVCQSLLFWRNKPNTFNWLFQTTYSEHPMEKNIIIPISSISSNFFRKKLEEIAIFQFPPGVPEEIHFFRKKYISSGRKTTLSGYFSFYEFSTQRVNLHTAMTSMSSRSCLYLGFNLNPSTWSHLLAGSLKYG